MLRLLLGFDSNSTKRRRRGREQKRKVRREGREVKGKKEKEETAGERIRGREG